MEQAQEVAWRLVKKEEGDALPDLVPYPKQKSFAEKIAEAVTSSDQVPPTSQPRASPGGLYATLASEPYTSNC